MILVLPLAMGADLLDRLIQRLRIIRRLRLLGGFEEALVLRGIVGRALGGLAGHAEA